MCLKISFDPCPLHFKSFAGFLGICLILRSKFLVNKDHTKKTLLVSSWCLWNCVSKSRHIFASCIYSLFFMNVFVLIRSWSVYFIKFNSPCLFSSKSMLFIKFNHASILVILKRAIDTQYSLFSATYEILLLQTLSFNFSTCKHMWQPFVFGVPVTTNHTQADIFQIIYLYEKRKLFYWVPLCSF